MPPSRHRPAGNPEKTFNEGEPPVLVNKLGIRDAAEIRRREKLALDGAYKTMLSSQAPDSRQFQITAATFKTIHSAIFGDLYEWAGRWRTVNIAKDGMKWPNAAFLDQSMQSFEKDVLQKVKTCDLQSEDDFCRAAARIHGEFIAVHPFREGNGRTARLACDLLAINVGLPILRYDRSPAGVERYVHANKLVVYRADYSLLENVFAEAVGQARELRHSVESSLPSKKSIESPEQSADSKAAIGKILASDLATLDAALVCVQKPDLKPER